MGDGERGVKDWGAADGDDPRKVEKGLPWWQFWLIASPLFPVVLVLLANTRWEFCR